MLRPGRFWFVLVLSGCTGGGGMDGGGPAPCSFEAVQVLFNRSCAVAGTTCHSASGTGGALQLDAPHAYHNIVGVPSTELSGVMIVQPGNSSQSFLFHKVHDSMTALYMLPGCVDTASNPQSCGVVMPMVGGQPLIASEVETIRCWIAAGAPNAGQPGTFDGGM